MYQVTVLDTAKGQRCIITTRLYQEFQNAFSDVVDDSSDIHATLEDYGKGVVAHEPRAIIAGGIKPNGYGDNFHFKYRNGIVIVIGEAIITDRHNIDDVGEISERKYKETKGIK